MFFNHIRVFGRSHFVKLEHNACSWLKFEKKNKNVFIKPSVTLNVVRRGPFFDAFRAKTLEFIVNVYYK